MKLRNLVVVTSVMVLVAAVCGCRSAGALLAPFPSASPGGAAVDTTAVVDNSADVQQALYQYKLGSGDKVRLIIFGEKDLSNEFVVSGSGMLSLPLIGEVTAQGLTATELQATVAKAYAQGYLKDPKVNIEVLNFRPFYILGEVNRPGEYPYSNGLTVVNAVARAEGYTYRADTRRVFIKHASQAKEIEIPLSSAVMVAPGDTIRIAERYF